MTHDDLIDKLDQAECRVYELQEELTDYDEDSEPWQLCHEELSDAENELVYFQERVDTGDWDE